MKPTNPDPLKQINQWTANEGKNSRNENVGNNVFEIPNNYQENNQPDPSDYVFSSALH